MITGINSANQDKRFLVKELVVDGKPYVAPEEAGRETADIDPVSLTGTYAKDHKAIEEKLNEIVALLSGIPT